MIIMGGGGTHHTLSFKGPRPGGHKIQSPLVAIQYNTNPDSTNRTMLFHNQIDFFFLIVFISCAMHPVRRLDKVVPGY